MPKILPLQNGLNRFISNPINLRDIPQQFLSFAQMMVDPIPRRLFHQKQCKRVADRTGQHHEDSPLMVLQLSLVDPQGKQFAYGEGRHGDEPD